MKKLKLFIAALALLGGGNLAYAQTDVTSTYITNPGFEGGYERFLDINTDRGVEKPVGWSVEWYQNNNDKNGMTFCAKNFTQDSKTWSAKSGKAYFARMRWGGATLYLRQTLQNLRPGSYTLSFSAAAYSAAAGATVQVSVAGQTQTILSGAGGNADGNWTNYTINFTVTAATPYATIEYKAERGSDNLKVGIDEFSLTYDGSTYYPTILEAAQALYDDNADWAENGLSDFSSAITSNSGKESIADKNAAIVALEEAMAAFKAANSVDMTAKITNPNFDSDISGWTTTGGDGNAFGRQTSEQTNFTGGFLEKWRNGWNGTYNQKNFDVNQQLTSLPNGEYTVKAYILAQMQGSKETLSDNYKDKKHGGPYYIDDAKGVWFYASSGENTANTWANSFTPTFGDTSGGVLRSATVKVENGTLTIGFKGIGSENGGTSLGTYANWIACDNWTLSYFGFDPTALLAQITTLKNEASSLLENEDYANVVGMERTDLTTASTLVPADEKKATLESVISQIQGAISAFTDAKANYDANASEVTKATALGVASATISTYTASSSSTAATALTNTQALKVAEYEYVTTNYSYGVNLGEWNSEGTNTSAATFNNEHWSGTTHDYKNQKDDWGNPKQGYAASSWSINFSQDVALPAGNYVFKVAGRQASGNAVTTSLVVKLGETELGSVNDFPRSNNSLGINKAGATSFDPTDEAGFANNGNGYGWEWRYVKFTLAADATVNIAISSIATDYNQWVSFGDYTLQTDNEANISLIAYNIALESAETTITNTDYTNVTGSEKTVLQAAIDADGTLDKTDKDAIDAATAALNEATSAFTAAKGAYDSFVAAKAVTYEEKPYASSTKFEAIATAQNAADATSAEDATTKTNAIISAYRKYVESNAMAEGVTSAEDKTSLIGDPNFAGVTISGTTAGAWAFDQTGGSANINSNEPFTDGDGNSNYSYFDYYNGSNNNQNLHQVIENLEPGRYILTVTARGHSNFNGNLQLYVVGKGSINIPAIGNSGGDFDRGWNDVTLEFTQIETSNITIGVKTNNSKAQWWGVTRFRLVKLSDVISENATTAPKPSENANVILYRTLSSGYWNTFSVPFNMEKPDGWEVKEFDSATDNVINFKDAESIVAGNPYLVKPASDVTEPMVFNGVTVSSEAVTKGEGNYKFAAQLFHDTSLPTDGTIAYLATDGTIKKLTSGGIKGLRAYFIIPAGSNPDNARIAFTDGDQTGIKDSFVEATNDNRVYDLQGRQVKAMKKGIYVVNGKKVIK